MVRLILCRKRFLIKKTRTIATYGFTRNGPKSSVGCYKRALAHSCQRRPPISRTLFATTPSKTADADRERGSLYSDLLNIGFESIYLQNTREGWTKLCRFSINQKKMVVFQSKLSVCYPSMPVRSIVKMNCEMTVVKCIDVLKCDLGSEFHIYIYMHSEFVPKIVNRTNTCVFDCMHFWTLCTRISKIRLSVHWNYKYN